MHIFTLCYAKSIGISMTQLRLFLLSLLTSTLLAGAAFADATLVMIEEKGCVWCARWNEQIAPIYPKTDAGKNAPLRRVDIADERPSDLTFARGLHFTPTFVLMKDGEEISRIEGYPGEDFFWGVLEKMMMDAKLLPSPKGS
ncbi:SoxS [Roseobacter sp. GAI101]|nr:SoxS [Roseobacter sp. GAI101]